MLGYILELIYAYLSYKISLEYQTPDTFTKIVSISPLNQILLGAIVEPTTQYIINWLNNSANNITNTIIN